jgi:hypothetical protein
MRLMLITLICLFPGLLKSQHVHFIYIQSDQQQLFYVKKSGEIISSSATGFVILPKLASGTHQFTIGFPKNQWPEYDFQVEVKSADRGFTLKNFDEKGWGLFDLQTAEVIAGRKIEPPRAQPMPEAPKSNDPFSVILASAVGDEGIRETGLIAMTVSKPGPVASKNGTAPPVVKKEVQPEEPKAAVTPSSSADKAVTAAPPPAPKSELPAVAKTETPPVAKTELPAVVKNETPPVVKAETEPPAVKTEVAAQSKPLDEKSANRSAIRKISEVRSVKRTELVFLDINGSVTDTVDVIIEDLTTDTKAAVQSGGTPSGGLPNRANCSGVVTDKEALSLRKKILTKANDEEVISAIMKEVKVKCFTTESLQSLSYVFVSDAMRYRLFEEAYPYIYDPANYGNLERLLNTEEYLVRFRALIKTN